jgi:hypothetical protein
MSQFRLILLVVVFVACKPTELPTQVAQSLPPTPTLTSTLPVQAPDLASARPVHKASISKSKDPYVGWDSWCEHRPEPCPKNGRCTPDHNGEARKCVRPWWSKTEKVCAISYSSPRRRKVQAKQVQKIVEAQCAGRCNSRELGKLIALVGMRESTMRPWKRHLLDGDVREGEKNWKKSYAKLAPYNRHYKQMERWGGNGLLGQQAVTFAPHWDISAPPEVLCRPTIAIATYLHCARVTHRKQTSMGIPPTWETLHASCSGGKVRPKGPSLDFRKRAARLGLDPDQRVPMAWLGVSPGKSVEVRNATAAAIETMVKLTEAGQI